MGVLISPRRLTWLPMDVRLAHEYCFFLHDEIARMFVEYERAEAHVVRFEFSSKAEGKRFEKLAKDADPLTALRALGRMPEARRVVLNTVTMAMVTDCAHHIYEGLRCFEKGKLIPGLTLLRKPLLDTLVYLTWMVADEDGFHASFTSGDPANISQKLIGNRRRDLIRSALNAIDLSEIVEAEELYSILFDVADPHGLYGLFQHAVHLVTIDRVEIKTSPENFNFIFSPPANEEMYRAIYACLPTVLIYLTRVVLELCQRIFPMDESSQSALIFRAVNGYLLLHGGETSRAVANILSEALSLSVNCVSCEASLRVTQSNAAKLLLGMVFKTPCRPQWREGW